MPRDVPEWRGKSDNAMPPQTVFDRLWIKQDGKDAITGLAFTASDKIVRDHIVPLIDGGENREGNLQLITADTHKGKTAGEATDRAKVRRTRGKSRGYVRAPSKWGTRPLGTGNHQHRASTPINKWSLI